MSKTSSGKKDVTEPESPPLAAKYQSTQTDSSWWKKSDSRTTSNVLAGLEPTKEVRLKTKPHVVDHTHPIPPPARYMDTTEPPKYDPKEHQHWRQLRERWTGLGSPKAGANAANATAPHGPASGPAVMPGSPSGHSNPAPATGAHWIRPASDLKPPSDASPPTVNAEPVAMVQSPKSTKPNAPLSAASSSNPAPDSAPMVLSPKLRPASDLPKNSAELQGLEGPSASSLSPLQKLRNFVRVGSAGTASGRVPAESVAGYSSVPPHQQPSPAGSSAGVSSPMLPRAVSHTAPVMDIGSPLPPPRRASFGKPSAGGAAVIASSANAQPASLHHNQSEVLPSATSATEVAGGGGNAAGYPVLKNSPPLRPQSPPPAGGAAPLQVQSPSASPINKPKGFVERVKGLWRRVSFSGTPASDRASDK